MLPSTVTGKKAKPAEATALGAAALGDLVEESSSVLAVAIGRSGHVISWNRAAEDCFGKLSRQVMGKSLAKAVGAKVARQFRAAMKAGAGQGTQVVVHDEGPRGPRRLHLECLAAPPAATTLFLATSQGTSADSKPSQGVRHMVRVGGWYPVSGVRLRSPKDLAQELRWRSDELETLNEELVGVNDELSVAEAATRAIIRRSSRSDTMLRDVIDTASRPFILCDANHVVVIWNRAAVMLYGLSSMQAVGNDLFALVPALDHSPLRDAVSKASESDKPGPLRVTQKGTEYFVDPILAKDGKRRHYLLRVGST